MAIEIRKLHPTFGVEILGVDLSRPLEPARRAEVARLLGRHGVCVFRNETPLDNEAHIAFSRSLGPLSRASTAIAGGVAPRIPFPEITDVSNLDDAGNILPPESRLAVFHKGDRFWHTDYSFVDNRATYSLLSAHVVPPEGGDTEFADMRAAYEALSDSMKAKLEDLVAEHWIWHSRMAAGYPEPNAEERASRPPVQHRLVHLHPGSGRRALYIASHASHIVGQPVEEGRALLRELTAFATQDDFVYRHRWRKGDLVVWDNLCTMHRATEFPSAYPRDMRRTTVRERPV